MNTATQALLSGGLSFGAVLLIALNELRTLRKFRGRDEDGPRRAPVPPPPPSPGGARVLPACLVPTAQWRAQRGTPVGHQVRGTGMIRSIVVAAACAVLVAGCGPQPPARPASSGVSSVDGGGEAQLGNTPRGTTNFPYSR